MLQVGASIFSIVLSLVSPTVRTIERAFLLDDPARLCSQMAAGTRLSIYLPEPLSYSDQVSDEQAFFLFQRVFRRYATLEFFPEPGFFQAEPGRSLIITARWSFIDRANNDRFVLRLFFLLEAGTGPGSPGRARGRSAFPWRIAEIKAEKL